MAYWESEWFDRENALSDVITGEFGETLEVRPMTGGVNARSAPDTSRPIMLVPGIYKAPSSKIITKSKIDAISVNPYISFDDRDLSWNPQRGDHVFRPRTGLLYQINDIKPTGHGRTRYELNHIGGRRQ